MAAVSHLVPHCVHFLRRGVINLVAIIGAVLMLLSQRAVSFETIIAGRFLYGFNSGEPAPTLLAFHPILTSSFYTYYSTKFH